MKGLLPLLFVVVGCSSPVPTPDGGGVDAGASDGGGLTEALCATQHLESGLVVCDALFATAPWLHLPADTATAVYGGLAHGGPGEVVFAGRTQRITLPVTSPAWLDRESNGSMRYGYFVYRATVSGGAVQDVVAVARLDDRVFQRLLAGAVLEGLASPRQPDAGDPTWTFDAREIPLRVRLDAAPQGTEVDSVAGFPRYALLGHVENAHGGVRASDGGCFPSLDSWGPRNPLFTATDGGVMVLRHPGMHAPLDDVFTLDWPEGTSTANNMGTGLFISVGDLLGAALPSPSNADSHPHGVPWGGPAADLAVVSGGGAACTP